MRLSNVTSKRRKPLVSCSWITINTYESNKTQQRASTVPERHSLKTGRPLPKQVCRCFLLWTMLSLENQVYYLLALKTNVPPKGRPKQKRISDISIKCGAVFTVFDTPGHCHWPRLNVSNKNSRRNLFLPQCLSTYRKRSKAVDHTFESPAFT